MIAEKVYVTPEEYLQLERAATFKSEYLNGEIIPMAGASTNHNLIKEIVAIPIGLHVRSNGKGCRSMSSDQRIYVPTNSLYTYPDIVVICGPNQYLGNANDILINPFLIVEVLSPGTAAYDRGTKFAHYRQSTTLQEYVLIDSEKVSAEVWRKHEQGFWFLASEAQQMAGSIDMASIGLTLLMSTIYAETEGILR